MDGRGLETHMKYLLTCALALGLTACSSQEKPRRDNGINHAEGKGAAMTGKPEKRPADWRTVSQDHQKRRTGTSAPAVRVNTPDATPPASGQSFERTRQLASEAHVRGEFAKAAELWRSALALKPGDGETSYALARSLARNKDARGAADAARNAYASGVKDMARYTDELDFSVVKDDPSWIGLMAEFKARAGK